MAAKIDRVANPPPKTTRAVNHRTASGNQFAAVVTGGFDPKTRGINLSIKAKDNAEEGEAMQRISADSQGANTGTTNLGALLKAKLDNKST